MKCLYFLLFVTASHAFVAKDTKEKNDIPIPNLVSLTALDPPGFKVEWTPVQSADNSDPILGYKVKVWEEATIKQYHYEMINGIKVLVEENKPVKFGNNDKIPEGKPLEIVVEGAKKSSALVEHIKVGVSYETRVQAYTKSGDGPLSQPMRLELLPNQADRHERDLYTVV